MDADIRGVVLGSITECRNTHTRGDRISLAVCMGYWRSGGLDGDASAPVYGIVHVSAGYTPEKYRSRGYNSACVARICNTALHDGASRCFGMVDTRNIAANRAYRGIGYKYVQEVVEVVRMSL